jgi:WD40 repeat protein
MDPAMPSLREKEVFEQALELPSGAERIAFARQACGDDAALCARVLALLEANETDHGFLPEAPAVETVPLPVSEKPCDRIGRYRLREKIGEGGCGIVYVAEQEEPVRRKVALKIIRPGMDTREIVARFEAERQALALMEHPNIAKALDAGATETGRPYFVMELVRGIRITDYCDQNKLATHERLDLFIQVCHAIQHAHQKGIIHRDIKPSNVLVTLHDGVPVPKVIDFGIAKAIEQKLTEKTVYTAFEQFLGTPAYTSPEQAEMSGLDIDTRSDIYALGVLLYELLTGKTPFDGKALAAAGLEEMRRTIREKEPLRPSTRLRTMLDGDLTTTAQRRRTEAPKLIHLLRGDLDWIVMKCLEKDRTRRYDTANGLARDIESYLSHEPIVARPPSSAYRVGKFVRRNKVIVAAASAVGLALFLGFLGSVWQATVATRARRVADTAREAERRQRLEAVAARTRAEGELYAANMNLAAQAWEQDNLGRLGRLLEATADHPDRGFEWYYWQRLAHLELLTLLGHTAGIGSVSFSPDSQRLFTADLNQSVKVWDAASGKELLSFNPHTQILFPGWQMSGAAFSPDGRRMVTGLQDENARVWDIAEGKELVALRGHDGAVVSVAFSPDGRRIATGGWDNTAKVWDATSGHELLTVRGHSNLISSVAFSSDGQRLATASWDYTAKVWRVPDGQELVSLKGHKGNLFCVAFSPDGRRIATGAHDQTTRVWDAASGQQLLTLIGRFYITSVAFSPDGTRIVTGSADQTARIWDARSGQNLYTLKGHKFGIWTVAFSPDGQRIVTGSGDWTAKVWDAVDVRQMLPLTEESKQTGAVAFSPDGQRVAVGTADYTVIVRELPTWKEVLTLRGHSSRVTSIAFSPDGRRIATGGGDDRTLKLWDAASGRKFFDLHAHSNGILSVGFSPDGRWVVTGGNDDTARMWDAGNGDERLVLRGHGNAVSSVAFSPDGKRIVTGSVDRTARVWDVAGGKELFTLRGHEEGVNSIAFSPDGHRLVTGGQEGTAKVWDAVNGKELLTFTGQGGAIRAVGFSPDGRRVLTGGWDAKAKLWEAATGRELLTLNGHKWGIEGVAFSPDGQRIATVSTDLRVWEAATPRQVAAWQTEEKAAAELRLTVMRKSREVDTADQRKRLAAIRHRWNHQFSGPETE